MNGRKSIRLPAYDYSRPALYYVTIVTHERTNIFGHVLNEAVFHNEFGDLTIQCWLDISKHFPFVDLDDFIVMPNHVHGIITISDLTVGARHASPLQPAHERIAKLKPNSLGSIIGSFKSAATKMINDQRKTSGSKIWQRNYYEHIIRDDDDLDRIRQYIRDNPSNWDTDENNTRP